jgi:hypothetical protein
MSQQLRTKLLVLLRDCHAKLNDPRGDGSGEGAVAPTGDHFNALSDLIGEAITEHRDVATGDPSDLQHLLLTVPGLEAALTNAAYTLGVEGEVRAALQTLRPSADPQVLVSVADLGQAVSAAESYADDLSSGLEEHIYEEGEDTLAALTPALERLSALVPAHLPSSEDLA